MKISKQFFIFLFVILLTTNRLFAQIIDIGPPDADIPIDGGLTLLIAGGIVYAGNALRTKMKKEKAE